MTVRDRSASCLPPFTCTVRNKPNNCFIKKTGICTVYMQKLAKIWNYLTTPYVCNELIFDSLQLMQNISLLKKNPKEVCIQIVNFSRHGESLKNSWISTSRRFRRKMSLISKSFECIKTHLYRWTNLDAEGTKRCELKFPIGKALVRSRKLRSRSRSRSSSNLRSRSRSRS